MGIRFIHTADWQLGKPFGAFDETLSGQLRIERQDVIARIAHIANEQAVAHVLVAGDVWDNATPNNAHLHQPLAIMAESPDINWWLLPGNHDVDGPDGLWDRIDTLAAPNVRLLRQAQPVEIISGVYLLPAPWHRIHHGQDLTAWMEQAETPAEAIRIGIAHGSIKQFGSSHDSEVGQAGDSDLIIPPDRAQRAHLDYLALGDWHARTDINDRTFYSGTPEPDRFKSGSRGQVLLVEIDAHGETPIVTAIETSKYDWCAIDAPLRSGTTTETLANIDRQIGQHRPDRHTLVQLTLSGTTTLSEWTELERYLETLQDRCAFLTVRGISDLTLTIKTDDLDTLDAQGSVRQAAETLKIRRDDTSLSEADRQIASEALRYLFSFAAQDESAA